MKWCINKLGRSGLKTSVLDETFSQMFLSRVMVKIGDFIYNKAEHCNPLPSSPLRDFIATMGYSAPVLRIDALTLVGPPLGLLPCHGNDRSPRSTHESSLGSHYLYAGRQPSSKQVPLGLILEFAKPPVSASSYTFRYLISSSPTLVSLNLI